MKAWSLLLIVLIIVGLIIFNINTSNKTQVKNLQSLPSSFQSTITIGKNNFFVEIADTPQKQSQGLSKREYLAQNSGMLFIFPQKSQYTFWMKDMLFALDFVWIADNTIVDLTPDVPTPINQNTLTVYQPKVPVNYVLELKAGKIRRANIKLGDTVIINLVNQSSTKKL